MGGRTSTIEAFRRLWEAYGRGRRDEVVGLFDGECVLQTDGGHVYRGHDGVRTLLDERDRAWKSLMLTYQHAEPVGDDRLVVTGHLTAFDHAGERALDAPLICLARFRHGRVVGVKTCADVAQALAEAAEESPPSSR